MLESRQQNELLLYFRTIRKWLWLIVLIAVASGVVALLVTLTRPASYESTSKIIIGSAVLGNPQSVSQSDVAVWEQLTRTYAELFQTRPVLENTSLALNLNLDIEDLEEKIDVRPITGTQLIEVVVTDGNPERAQAINTQLFAEVLRLAPGSSLDEEQIAFIEGELAALAEDINTLRQEIDDIDAELRADIPSERRSELEASRFQKQSTLNTWQTSYTTFLEQISDPGAIEIVEAASVGKQVSRNVSLYTILAVLVGAMLSTGAVFLVEYIDDTIRNPDQINMQIRLNTLATIARIKGEDRREKLVSLSQPRSPIAEAFRILRSNILFAAPDEAPLRTVMLTSSGPSEGKSLTAANLAVVLAQAGYRVILVDADLRRPDLHHYFGVDNRAGLTSEFIKTRDSNNLGLQNTGVPGLVLMPSGPLPYNPVELIGSARMREVIENLKEIADFVILDSPPVYALADAPVLSTQVDAVIFVIEAGKTGFRHARRSLDQLQSVGANVLGVVLNRVKDQVATYAEYSTYPKRT
ncbi:MAG: polysaccharide biosynthesis tyrosine autokinase [Anaerolineae bacterium]|nr:MAG: polysaccharide biosynthesis tyrosine autokinase [Anaerolineae bacterium]